MVGLLNVLSYVGPLSFPAPDVVSSYATSSGFFLSSRSRHVVSVIGIHGHLPPPACSGGVGTAKTSSSPMIVQS